MGVSPRAIHATGGASANRQILQVMADVFGADVHRFQVGNAACLGAAMRAWHAEAAARGHDTGWHDVMRGLAEPLAGSRLSPNPAATATYASLQREHAAFEAEQAGAESPRP
jgi:xylulokinase